MCELFNRQFDFQRETEKTVSSFYLDCFFLDFCDEPTKRFFIWILFRTISANKGTLNTFLSYCDIQKSKINNIKRFFLNWKLTHFVVNRILYIFVNWVISNYLSRFYNKLWNLCIMFLIFSSKKTVKIILRQKINCFNV